MTDFATIHGFEFTVEAQGFSHHERDRDLCIRRLWNAMERMTPVNVAKLHADLLANVQDDAEFPQRAARLCHSAISMQCGRWFRRTDLHLNLNAVPAPTPEEIAEQERKRTARKSLQREFEAHMQQRPAGHPRSAWQALFWQAHGL